MSLEPVHRRREGQKRELWHAMGLVAYPYTPVQRVVNEFPRDINTIHKRSHV